MGGRGVARGYVYLIGGILDENFAVLGRICELLLTEAVKVFSKDCLTFIGRIIGS